MHIASLFRSLVVEEEKFVRHYKPYWLGNSEFKLPIRKSKGK